MPRQLQSVVQKLRLHGVHGLGALLRSNVWNDRECSVWATRLDASLPAAEAGPGITVAEGSLDELRALRASWSNGGLPDAFCADLVYGLTRFYLAFCAGKIAHVSWFTSDRWTFNVDRAPGDWEIRDVFTLEPYRGHGIASIVLRAIVNRLKEENVRRVFAHVEKGNRASEKAMSKAGLRRVGTIHRTRILGIERVTRTLSEGWEML